VSEALRRAVLELESHASSLGWDQPAMLFALVETAALSAAEPELAEQLGIEPGAEGLTPVQQDLPDDTAMESVLRQIEWPDEVAGCAVVLERLVLPPGADADLPEEDAAAAEYAAAHPDRQEVRMVVAATRDDSGYCAIRLRAHDDNESVIDGVDLVPALLELVRGTLK
jgi:hypothetical protein